MSSIRNLTDQIIDYAGLFPPAKLPLDEVVRNYANYLAGDDRWMLARLILPAAQLSEFETLPDFVESESQWKLSVLIPSVDVENDAFAKALQSIESFNTKYQGFDRERAKAIADTVEVKTSNAANIKDTIAKMPSAINAFLEISHRDDPTELIATIANSPQVANDGDNIFAKIRTGGVTPDLMPSSMEVARFVIACARHDVGFKATAGLHHPLRGDFRLTYEPDADLGTMFGFVNVFVAASFAFTGQTEIETIQQILEESDPSAFDFGEEKLSYGNHSVSAAELGEIRKRKAISFGSCSFTEPTTELRNLGWLESVAS